MTRTRALCLVLALCGWTGAAHAVALGEIEVSSFLNQKIVGTIPVATSKPGELEGATVELASNEEFERAGLDRAEFLSSMRFEVKDNYIKVTSKELAREPVLTLLLDVRWIGGRLLREYTILLDLPPSGSGTRPKAVAVAPTAPAPAAAPAPAPAETTPAGTEPAQSQMAPEESAPEAAPAPSAPTPIASTSGGTYGPTAPQETLWSIAYKLRPDLSLTMDQMQVAIFNANPQAFDHGRINGLMKNQTLRVPTADEIRAVDPAAAKAQVAEARGAPAPAPAPRPAKPKPEPKAEAAPPPAYVPPPAPKVAEAPKPEPKPEPKAEVAPPPASVPPPASTLSQSKPEPAPAPETTPAPQPKAEAAPAPAPEVAKEEPKPAPAPAPAKAPSPSLASDLVDRGKELVTSPLFGAGVALFVLLVAGILGYRKIGEKIAKWKYDRAARKAAAPAARAPSMADDATASAPAEAHGGSMGDDTPTLVAPQASSAPVVAATQVMAAQTMQQTMQSTMQETSPGMAAVPQAASQTQMVEPAAAQTGGQKVDFDVTGNFANETVQINLDAGDPVSEAEFHRAYGLYDEAALLLKQALQKEPGRKDARIKLAEIYFEASKANEFVEVARELKGQLNDTEWQQIALLGTQIAPGNELFAGGATATGTVDLSFDEPAAPEAQPASPPAAAPAASAGALDFKLDEVQLDVPAAEPAAAPAAAAAPAEGGLEFDLGSLSLDTPAEAPAAAPAQEPSLGAPAAAPAAEAAPAELNLADFDLGTEGSAPAESLAGESTELSLDMPVEAPGDESSTKLDLARAYIDMGDNDMAKSLLNEVVAQGNAQQKNEAQELLKRVPA